MRTAVRYCRGEGWTTGIGWGRPNPRLSHVSYLGTGVNQRSNISREIGLLVNEQPGVPLGQDTVRLADIVRVEVR